MAVVPKFVDISRAKRGVLGGGVEEESKLNDIRGARLL